MTSFLTMQMWFVVLDVTLKPSAAAPQPVMLLVHLRQQPRLQQHQHPLSASKDLCPFQLTFRCWS